MIELKNCKLNPDRSSKAVGYNTGKIDEFKGIGLHGLLDSVIREYFQNSKDAYVKSKDNDVFTFKFYRKKTDLSFYSFKELNEYVKKIQGTIRHSSDKKRIKDIIGFLDKNSPSYDKVPCLFIEDNGTGLDGISWKRGEEKSLNAFVSTDISSKEEGNSGSFGKGKITAFNYGIDTKMFFSKNYKTKHIMFMGLSNLATVKGGEDPRGDNIYLGPDFYFGKNVQYRDDKTSDCAEISQETLDKYRTIDSSGLTVIIPSEFELDNENWIDYAVLSLYHSFFDFFKNNDFKVEIHDEFFNKEFIIDKDSYVDKFLKLSESEIFFNNPNEKYIFNLIKNFITEENLLSREGPLKFREPYKVKGESGIKGTKGFSGDLNLMIYKDDTINPDETNNQKDKNFFYVRDNMTVRSEYFPKRGGDERFCGYFYFSKRPEIDNKLYDDINKVYRSIEESNHDRFNYEKVKVFEINKKTWNNLVTRRISKDIREKIENYIEENASKDIFEYDADLLNYNSGNNDGDSSKGYDRKFRLLDKQEKKTISSGNRLIINEKQPETGEKWFYDKKSKKFKIIEDTPDNGGNGIKPSPPKPRQRPASPFLERLSQVRYRSKFLGREEIYSNYQVNIFNLDEIDKKFDMIFDQASVEQNPILSFKLDKIELGFKNKKEDIFQEFSTENNNLRIKKNSDGNSQRYILKNIDSSNYDQLYLYLRLIEPSTTYSEFKITFKEITDE